MLTAQNPNEGESEASPIVQGSFNRQSSSTSSNFLRSNDPRDELQVLTSYAEAC